MDQAHHSRQQGDLGEVAAIAWLTKIGGVVCTPLVHSPDYDLVAELEGRLLRVQVKTSGYRRRPGTYSVQVATSGGNRSWTGKVKDFDPCRCDFLFALLADGRRWFIPADVLEARTAISLGGEKYSEFEIDPAGAPAFAFPRPLESGVPSGGSADVGESGGPVKSVLLAEWVRIPPPPSQPDRLHADCTRTGRQRTRGRAGQALIRRKRQLTMPLSPFKDAGLEVGDRLRARAEGEGRVVFERIDDRTRAEAVAAAPGEAA